MALGLPRMRINHAGCLNRCEMGPTMVIYPEGVWYTYRNEADIDEILKSHVMKGGARRAPVAAPRSGAATLETRPRPIPGVGRFNARSSRDDRFS